MIDVHSIGAGGGSIAWVDSGGALRVGPRSAGARPGPACYGLGGTEPTVTDADLLLGYLGADSFAGGEIALDVGLAERAIREGVAIPLGLDVVEAAYAIYRIVNANMANGIRVVSVQRGHDPREFSLMAFGGAGGVHAAVQAHDLGIPTIVVPRAASVFCALGDLIADVRITEVRTFAGELTAERFGALARLFAELEATTRAQLPATGLESVEVDRWADLRYLGEVHEVAVPVRAVNGLPLEAAHAQVVEAFHSLHEQLYAYRDLENRVEVLNVRADAVGRTWKPALAPAEARPGEGIAARKGTRPAYFGEAGGYREVPVYDGPRLRPGDRLAGPCIVEEAWTTILVLPGDVASLDPYANYVITLGGRS
jgi:N-methylhydantoinase A